MSNKILKLSVFAAFLGLLTLGFAGVAGAQYDASYYYNYSSTTYPYQQSYTNNSSYPSAYQNTSMSYPSYGAACPVGFISTIQNNIQLCYKYLGIATYDTSYPNTQYNNYYPNYGYNTPAINTVPGCLPGYLYSTLTGQRCDGNNYYNYYNGYNNGIINGNGIISSYSMRDGNDTDNLEEGDSNREIAEARFDARNGDVRLDRVELRFEFTGFGFGEDLPWNTFEEVRLLSDGREIGRMSTDSRSDWDSEGNDEYSLTFSGLNEIIREDDQANLTVEVDLNSSISGSGNGYVSWEVFIPDDGIRYRDGGGSTSYEGDDGERVFFDIDEN